jgi:uncharacterized protein (TIGR02453 family)
VPVAMSFAGFPVEGLEFYTKLEADNTRVFWLANKATYDNCIKAPMEALIAEVDERFRPLRMFRPNRDVRFAKDKSPYKTACGATGEREGGAIYYVQFSSAGLLTASGYYMMEKDQLEKFRAAIAAEKTGKKWMELVEHYRTAKGMRLNHGGNEPLKTAPKGYDKDHPRIEYLRWKGATVFCEHGAPKWLQTSKTLERVNTSWAACDPLNDWLDKHVGPTELTPPDGWNR